MSSIDRRMLLGAAGAGLVLAAVPGDSGRAASPRRASVSGGDDDGGPSGSCLTWGQSARTKRDNSDGPKFDPSYVCAVYIRYEENGRPTIRHAYKNLTVKTDEAIRQAAEDTLKALKANVEPYPAGITNVRWNFHKFTMNSQQAIVLLIDNDPAIIRFNEDDDLENLIIFTHAGGTLPYKERKANYAFYNLKRIPMTQGLFKQDGAFRVDFWNTDETDALLNIQNGDPESRWYMYSMNIHLLQAPSVPKEISMIPVVLDPDTGNMGAQP